MNTGHESLPPVADLANVMLGQAVTLWSQGMVLAWQSLIAWPSVSAAMQQQAWDSWIAHWGGGVPLDG